MMLRHLSLPLITIGLLSGCAGPQMAMEPPKKPSRAPEMEKLARFLGTWSFTAEMVEPSPEDMKAMMPEEAEEMPESFAGGGTGAWALDGMALTNDGWFEMGPDEKVHYIEYWSWDPKAKKYRIWSMTNWGESSSGWAQFSPDDKTMQVKASGHDAEGNKIRGEGTLTFDDADTMSWTFTEIRPTGKMKLKGTSKRGG